MKVDARSDIFSFGSVLYEMVSGRQAFQGNSTISTLGAVIHNEPSALGAEVPHDLHKIVTRCLRKDPARRIQTTADLKVSLEELKEESESGRLTSVHPMPPRFRRSLLVWPVALSALLVVAAIVYWPVGRPPTQLQVVPLTTYPGFECCASFSPDGSQVAFTWNGEKQDNFDIYIQVIGTGKPLRRSIDPARDGNPAWSPDGRFIAFRRQRGENVQIVLMPALNGPETVLAEAFSIFGRGAGSSLAWTPDSRWVVYSSQDSSRGTYSLYMVSPDTREQRRLTTPMNKTFGDLWPVLRPDGHAIAFVRSPAAYVMDLYVLKLSSDFAPQGEAERLTTVDSLVHSPTWTADGREVIYSLGSSSESSLWRVAAVASTSGGGPAKAERLALPGRSVGFPAVSSLRRRLVYTAGRTDQNIWRTDIAGPNNVPFSRRLIASTYSDRNARFSPDGKRIVFVSTRSGKNEIWLCDQDGSGEEKLTSMEAAMTGSPRWSPDGEWVVYDSNAQGQFDIYMIRAKGGRPRRLTTDPADDAVASWSRDGNRVYFVSNRSGRWQVWQSAAGGSAVQVTKNGGYVAFESEDGKSLYYTITNLGVSSLFKVSVESGQETKVIDAVQGGSFAVAEKGIYFIPPADISGRSSIQFFEFSTGRTQRIAVLENASEATSLSVSSDGRSFIYTRVDHEDSDLMLVENFR